MWNNVEYQLYTTCLLQGMVDMEINYEADVVYDAVYGTIIHFNFITILPSEYRRCIRSNSQPSKGR